MLDLDRCMANVIHKRKRLVQNVTSGLSEKMDKLIENIEKKISRAEEASHRAEGGTVIIGTQKNVSILNDRRSINIVNNVIPGDITSLETALLEIGVSRKYIDELRSALAIDSTKKVDGALGENTERWLGKVLRSVGKGTTKVAGDVASAMLTKIVAIYCGLPS